MAADSSDLIGSKIDGLKCIRQKIGTMHPNSFMGVFRKDQGGPLGPRFFFVKDRPKGPSTANHQPPPTANRHQPPTASGDQPPTANHCQPPSTTNLQPPIATNRHQPPVANRQPPTAKIWCARGHFWETWVQEHLFFSSLRTALGKTIVCTGKYPQHPTGGGGSYKLEFLLSKFCTKILYAISLVFLRICAGNTSKRPLFLMSNY